MKVCVFEDDADLYELIRYSLEQHGFEVAGARRGREALSICRQERPDVILLDVMLPDADGLEICKLLRRDTELGRTPILFVSARACEVDRVIGLEVGGNDYIVKPFYMRELIARIRNQVREPAAETNRSIQAGNLELDRDRCRVLLNGEEKALTATEFRMLELLMSRPGVVFSRQQVLDGVWGKGRALTDRAVDVYMLRLRQKLEEDPANPKMLRCVRGFGYTFDAV